VDDLEVVLTRMLKEDEIQTPKFETEKRLPEVVSGEAVVLIVYVKWIVCVSVQ